MMTQQFKRHAELQRNPVQFTIDGVTFTALEGDTVLTAILCNGKKLREHELTGSPRAGFCLMGACQDCWVWLTEGKRIRSCTTFVREGMSVSTSMPDESWSIRL